MNVILNTDKLSINVAQDFMVALESSSESFKKARLMKLGLGRIGVRDLEGRNGVSAGIDLSENVT